MPRTETSAEARRDSAAWAPTPPRRTSTTGATQTLPPSMMDAINRQYVSNLAFGGPQQAGVNNFVADQLGERPPAQGDPVALLNSFGFGASPSGGGGGGGGGAALPARQPWDFRSDPSYMALLRTMDLDENQLRARNSRSLANLDQAEPIQIDDLRRERDRGIRDLDTSYEARGLYRSGERLERGSELLGDYGRQETGIVAANAMQRADLQDDLTASLAELARRRAENELRFAAMANTGVA